MREKSRFRTRLLLPLSLTLSLSLWSVAFLDHRSDSRIVEFFKKNTRRGFPRSAPATCVICVALLPSLHPCRMWNRVWVWRGLRLRDSGGSLELFRSAVEIGVGVGFGLWVLVSLAVSVLPLIDLCAAI